MKLVRLVTGKGKGNIIVLHHTVKHNGNVTAIQGTNLESPFMKIKSFDPQKIEGHPGGFLYVTKADAATVLTDNMQRNVYQGERKTSNNTTCAQTTKRLQNICRALSIPHLECKENSVTKRPKTRKSKKEMPAETAAQ